MSRDQGCDAERQKELRFGITIVTAARLLGAQ